MKLNPNCIKDILLTVEEYDSIFSTDSSNYELLANYSEEEILYHAKQINYSNLVVKFKPYVDGSFSIKDLTPKGHEFLDSIRNSSKFMKVIDKTKSLGELALPTLIETAIKSAF